MYILCKRSLKIQKKVIKDNAWLTVVADIVYIILIALVSSNLVHDVVYSIQHSILILWLSVTCDKWVVYSCFLQQENDIDLYDVAEIFLKVALNTHNS